MSGAAGMGYELRNSWHSWPCATHSDPDARDKKWNASELVAELESVGHRVSAFDVLSPGTDVREQRSPNKATQSRSEGQANKGTRRSPGARSVSAGRSPDSRGQMDREGNMEKSGAEYKKAVVAKIEMGAPRNESPRERLIGQAGKGEGPEIQYSHKELHTASFEYKASLTTSYQRPKVLLVANASIPGMTGRDGCRQSNGKAGNGWLPFSQRDTGSCPQVLKVV